MNITIMNDSSCNNAFLSTLKSAQPDLLLISPYSKGDVLLNKIDSLSEVIGMDYLKRLKPYKMDEFLPNILYPNLRNVIQISGQSIPKTEKFFSTVKFSNEDLSEFLKTYNKEENSHFLIYEGNSKKKDLTVKLLWDKINVLVKKLKIKQFSVIGTISNEGIAYLICLLLPIVTCSQIIFIEENVEESYGSLDFLFIKGDKLKYITEKFHLEKVKNLVIFTRDINFKEENKQTFENLTTKIYILDEDI